MAAIFFRNQIEAQLIPFWQYQGADHPTGCGPYSLAMALNLWDHGQRRGDQLEIELERRLLKPKGFGIPAWAFGRAVKSAARVLPASTKFHAVIPDIKSAVNFGMVVIVSVSWQTNSEILRELFHANPGHYMVFVGYDDASDRLYFLDPGDPMGEYRLRVYTHAEFTEMWILTSNIFIPRGSMFTLAVK